MHKTHDYDIIQWAEHLYTGTQQHSLTQHLTIEDLATWLDGEGVGNEQKVQEAVVAVMGTQTVDYYEIKARLPYALEYALGITQKQHVGGVDITKSFD